MMMPVTENAASFVLPIPASPASIPIYLSDIISPLSVINNKLFPPQQVSRHKEQPSQDQPKYEVADIFNRYGEEYRKNHKLTTDQLNVMYAIEHCRTAETAKEPSWTVIKICKPKKRTTVKTQLLERYHSICANNWKLYNHAKITSVMQNMKASFDCKSI